MKNWYAVSTKYKAEFLALENLERQNICTYLPRIHKSLSEKNKLTKKLYRAFFPGYLFVHIDIKEERWQKINSTIGVSKIISFGSYPFPISNFVINEMQKLEDENGVINYNDKFIKNDNIVIKTGIFSGSAALFDTHLSGKDRVRVLLNVMGISTGINLNAYHIQKN